MSTTLNGSVIKDSGINLVTHFDWDQVDTVMVDMDGTLIDLCFDYVLWNQVFPGKLAKKHGISVTEARNQLYADHQPPFSLDFYSVDYWTRLTGIDLMEIHESCSYLLRYRPGAVEFLDFLRSRSIRVVLATNAHPKSIALKDSRLQILDKVDAVHSSSNFGVAKDFIDYWDCMSEVETYSRMHTLFIDDVSFILDKGWEAGIQHLMTIKQPNSRLSARTDFFYPVIDDFRDLIPN